MSVYNVSAGHNPAGKKACGAVGILNESTEARTVKDILIQMLRGAGHTVYDCTVDNGRNQDDVLKKIVAKCNQHVVDLDISIHFNSGRNDYGGDGSTGGCETYSSLNGRTVPIGQKICNNISALGLRIRGAYTRGNLYFLNQTKNKALLIECCFVDDMDDVRKYNPYMMALAIFHGLTM